MFELLFNEPLTVWRESAWLFESGWPGAGLAAAIAVAAVVLLVSLWRVTLSPGRKLTVGLLQWLVAGVALTMLWRPALEVERTRDGENSVAWLIDHSGSMDSTDVGGLSRREAVVSALLETSLLDDARFTARIVAMGESPSRLESLTSSDDLPAASPLSGIASALESELADVGDTSLAAIVLLSDGADNVGTVDAAFWQRLARAAIPVHAVGVGETSEAGDIELADVRLPAQVDVDAPVRVRLRIVHPRTTAVEADANDDTDVDPGEDAGRVADGFSVDDAASDSVRLRATHDKSLLFAEDIVLTPGATETVHTVTLDAGEAGLKRIEFALDARTGEPNTINNRQSRVLDVRDAPRRVLYVEGEPRWEYKFLRRALLDTSGLEIVSLLRTSPNKFYRQGVRDGQELANGFPATREELFAYDAVIIGSFSAAELSAQQQATLRDFVNVRGGALLMLAGRQGLADGGWARSGVSAALPVSLDARLGSDTYRRERVAVMPTRQGLREAWLRFDEDVGRNALAWRELPEVADHQLLGVPKPGARVLLESGSGAPVLAVQRYGRGTSYVLGTSGTWRWQMGLPSDDDRHERFWRGLVGEVVADTLQRVSIETTAAVVRDSGATRVMVDALDAGFLPLTQATLQAIVTTPGGARQPLELIGDSGTPGRFTGSLSLDVDGPWGIAVTTPPEGEAPASPAASAEHWFLRESGTAESFGARQQDDFLRRVASTSGGRYLPLADVGELPGVLEVDNAALKRSEVLPLWNLPIFFLLLLLGKLTEWSLRLRWKRL